MNKAPRVSSLAPAEKCDWREIHERVIRLRSVIEQGWIPTADEKSNILRTRARALAREPETTRAGEEQVEVVEFRLADEHYAVEAGYVREVQPLREFTPLPGTPSFVLGLVNVRGQLLSVIDLKKFFELPERGLTDLNKVIVVRSAGTELGILADGIVGAGQILRQDVQEPPTTLTGIRAEYLRGIGRDGLVLLDVEKLLSSRTIVVHEQVE